MNLKEKEKLRKMERVKPTGMKQIQEDELSQGS